MRDTKKTIDNNSLDSNLSYADFERRFRDKQYIGSGGFAKVYKVFDHSKNHYVALKVADVRPEHKKFSLKNEVELINNLPYHRNIARYDSCYRFNTGFTGEMDFAILQFYEYGNLEQFLKKEKLDAQDKRVIIQSILKGISFLHKNNVIHRDLKSQNILLHREDGVWTPKITDFGLSRLVSDEVSLLNSSIGHTVSYAAPEQIKNKKISRNVDLWAAGVIMYRIIAGELPFVGSKDEDSKSSNSQLELSKKIVTLDLPKKLDILPQPYRDMIRRCLVLDPSERAQTADELISMLNVDKQADVKSAAENTDIDKGDKTKVYPQSEPTSLGGSQGSNDGANSVVKPIKEYIKESELKTELSYNVPKDYSVPNANVTQIIDVPEVLTEIPKPITSYQPNTGASSSRFKMIWLLPLLIIAIAYGAWTLYSGSSDTTDDSSGGVITIFDEDATGGANSVWFEELIARINVDWEDEKEYSKIKEEIESRIEMDNSADYRAFYKLSVSLANHEGGSKLTYAVLEKSFEVAKKYNEADMLKTSLNSKEGVKVKEVINSRDWRRLKRDLERAIRIQKAKID